MQKILRTHTTPLSVKQDTFLQLSQPPSLMMVVETIKRCLVLNFKVLCVFLFRKGFWCFSQSRLCDSTILYKQKRPNTVFKKFILMWPDLRVSVADVLNPENSYHPRLLHKNGILSQDTLRNILTERLLPCCNPRH